ncbi:MAG: helix-turn-helix domain-containing protein [Oscillospiraceae bacterium]|nr:helix-turn-helix domain-containing protein [Oscillospiraceae bacterium]
MDQRNAPRKSSSRPVPAAATLMAALILGICLIISAAIISSSLKKLTTAVNEKDFASTYSAPSNLTVKPESTDYFTAAEAAQYLKITESEVKAAITKGEISEYISTSAGYSISKKALDEYFSDKAYAQLLNDNNAGGDE